MDTSRDTSIDESVRRRFEAAWIANQPQPIGDFLPLPSDPAYLATLEELVHIDLEFSWRNWTREAQGTTIALGETLAEPPRVESYLKQFAGLNSPDIVSRLLHQERTVRLTCGDLAPIEEFRRRFPSLVETDGQVEGQLLDIQVTQTALRVGQEGQSAGVTVDNLPPLGKFGNFELLEEIGRGGMGVVYRAYQPAADRTVALKVIRRDRLEGLEQNSQTSAIDRFRQEAQAAGRLQHDHIVTVFDVGEVDGSQFFSMRYVQGQSLAEIIRKQPLQSRRAAAYLEPVSRAVATAHAAGILHRDLKPHNILVDTLTDRALVADFGLAKLADVGDELTRVGEVMGTPAYMSPEQARDTSQVTLASDVYSLGATLYCLITGRPPFQAATTVDTLRQVIDEQPISPRELNPSIDRDLDTIALKCLEKDPQRRYSSCDHLADELQRYLNREPIHARPVGMAGRTWRWCIRNPVIATLVGLTGTFLVLALLATGVGYIKATAEQQKGDRNLQEALNAIDRFYSLVSEHELLNKPGLQSLRRDLLQDALRYYQRFEVDYRDNPSVRDRLAETWFRIGEIHKLIGSPENALAAYKIARVKLDELWKERPHDLEILRTYGRTLNATGQMLQDLGKLDEAESAYTEAIDVRRSLADLTPQSPEFQRTLANTIMNLGLLKKDQDNLEAAEQRFRSAQQLRESLIAEYPDNLRLRRDFGLGCYSFAQLKLAPEELTEEQWRSARQDLENSVAAFQHVAQQDPKDQSIRLRLAVSHRVLADVLRHKQMLQEARLENDRAQSVIEPLARANPDVTVYQVTLAELYTDRGWLEKDIGNHGEAIDLFERAVAFFEPFVDQNSGSPEYRHELAVSMQAAAECEFALGDTEAARTWRTKSREHLRWLTREYPENKYYQSELADLETVLKEVQ